MVHTVNSELCLSLLCVKYMLSGHSTVQESLPVVLLYLKASTLRACPRDPKAVLFCLANFLLEALHG